MRKDIENYQPNQKVIDQFMSKNFVVLAGPAAAGKDTLREGLLNLHPGIYQNIVSVTTRQPRPEETEGKTYHFVSEYNMTQMLKDKTLLQVALVHNQQVSALDSSELENLESNKIGLSILVVQTELQLHQINPNLKTIFLIPPSYEELIKRLDKERVTKKHETKNRLNSAIREIEIALSQKRYFCIVSDERQRVINISHNYLKSGFFDQSEDQRARTVMKKILEDIKRSKVS